LGNRLRRRRRLLGDTALSIYTLYRLPGCSASVWRVSQAVSLLLQHPGRIDLLRRGFLATIRYTQVVIVPLCFGLFIAADPAVGALFGDQWGAAVPVLRLMAVFSLIGSIGVNAGDVYKALGRSGVLARLAMLELVALVPALIIGAHHGIVGVAWAHAIVATVDTTVRLVVATRMVGISGRQIWDQIRPSLAAGLWLAAAAVPVLWLTRTAGDAVSLLATAFAGCLAYVIALWRLDPIVIRRMMGWLRGRRKAAA
jgi:PST family polysaccharide transporter